MNCTVASVPQIRRALNFLMNRVLFVTTIVPKYFNFATLSKDLLLTFI
jgi:hypothetical protein